MKRIFLYVVSANKNPDYLNECSVPFEIDKREIYFGPCKIKLREKLNQIESVKNGDEIYFVGLNGLNSNNVRKIIWAGKVKQKLTFAEAFDKMNGYPKYDRMMNEDNSPLHVEPIRVGNELIGYKRRSKMHSSKDGWIKDIVKDRNLVIFDESSHSIYKREKHSVEQVFNRDCCFIFKNIFFSNGQGISINGSLLKLLIQRQRGVKGISVKAPFGLDKSNNINGRRGLWLEITGKLAEQFLEEIDKEKQKIKFGVKKSGSIKSSGKCKC